MIGHFICTGSERDEFDSACSDEMNESEATIESTLYSLQNDFDEYPKIREVVE